MSRPASIILVATLALLSSRTASAIYQCGDQKDDCNCGMNNPYPCCDNGGNCTWWAWKAACCNWHVGLPGWGNANQWAGNAKANPKFEVKSAPVPNSIGVRVSGSYGHVVWVTAVNGSTITVKEMNCWGNYGMRTYTYNASYFDGGYIVLKGTAPVCTSGQTQSQSCGQCGKQTRTCNSSGQWGTWGTCGGEGPCAANKTDTQTCGSGGHQTRTCDKTCQWGAWSACAGGTEFSPGKTETQPCPDPTRSRTRTCSASGAWGAWSNCPSSGADGGVPGVDSGAGWIEPPNGGGDDLGASNPHSSANAGGGELTGGCQLAGNNEPAALAGVLVLLGLAALRRRR